MSRKSQPLGKVYQRRNGRILMGERIGPDQQEQPKVVSNPSFRKGHKNPSFITNSKTNSSFLPPINEQKTRQSRSQSKVGRVALRQQMEQPDTLHHRTTQRHVTLCANPQDQQRKPQQAKMVTIKLSVARQHDAGEKLNDRNGGRTVSKDGTMTHKPSLAHPTLPALGTRRRITTRKSGTSGRQLKPQPRSKQHESGENQQSVEKPRNASNQDEKARNDQMKPRSRRVGAMNKVLPERRVAFQQETSEVLQCTDRRIGLCILTDPAQQHLTFIRVLRKRF